MNGFDGALTTLGVIMGAYIAGVLEIKLILSAGFGASLAMGISGATGAYMAEKAERVKSMKELEEAMFTTLNDTVIE
jgi:predicted membrane protein (TIGR00267 family)